MEQVAHACTWLPGSDARARRTLDGRGVKSCSTLFPAAEEDGEGRLCCQADDAETDPGRLCRRVRVSPEGPCCWVMLVCFLIGPLLPPVLLLRELVVVRAIGRVCSGGVLSRMPPDRTRSSSSASSAPEGGSSS